MRDKIVADQLAKGQKPTYHTLSPADHIKELAKKIAEEAGELATAPPQKLAEEIADVEQALDDLKTITGVDPAAVAKAKAAKLKKNGGFKKGIYVETIELAEADPWTAYYRTDPKRFKEVRSMEVDFNRATRQTYDDIAARWASSHEQEKPFWEPELKIFHKLLPGGHVLEIGFGGGRDAESLIALGYKYTGTDNSPGMLKAARKAHPGVRFLRQDVCGLRFPRGTQFDGFWAAAVLLHLPKSRIDTAMRQIHTVMRPGAIGVITLREGKGEGLRQTTKHGLPDNRYFAGYTDAEFRTILIRNNFEVLRSRSRAEGDQYTWLAFFVKVLS